ncbi:GIY-YIG nuclease family protein [Nocardia flavorosea]|uniref:GIY-YIG nuclease family protein n=1 Tax=Nocardia flavorosea TaxID=53429 RepID=UPI0024587581|nr:GIY-YIG nuclease family protein [Nocardia flavorosea]
MGYVYGFRLGEQDLFKIGQTASTPQKRRPSLQTGCPYPLTLFDAIESDDYKAGEKFVKDNWPTHRSDLGGKEIFRFTTDEAYEVFRRLRTYLEQELPRQRRAEELNDIEPTPETLPADDALLQLRRKWTELTTEEQRLQAAITGVTSEKALVETELKLAIGTHTGIEGVATWARTKETRRINPELVKADDPELYERFCDLRFNATRFRSQNTADDYGKYQEVHRSRELKIIE